MSGGVEEQRRGTHNRDALRGAEGRMSISFLMAFWFLWGAEGKRVWPLDGRSGARQVSNQGPIGGRICLLCWEVPRGHSRALSTCLKPRYNSRSRWPWMKHWRRGWLWLWLGHVRRWKASRKPQASGKHVVSAPKLLMT